MACLPIYSFTVYSVSVWYGAKHRQCSHNITEVSSSLSPHYAEELSDWTVGWGMLGLASGEDDKRIHWESTCLRLHALEVHPKRYGPLIVNLWVNPWPTVEEDPRLTWGDDGTAHGRTKSSRREGMDLKVMWMNRKREAQRREAQSGTALLRTMALHTPPLCSLQWPQMWQKSLG